MKPSVQRRISDPAIEPVTLDEVKVQCRVDHNEDDAYLTTLITVAREWCEEYVKRAFIEQTWECGYECWPCDGVFELVRPNTLDVESFIYRDADDTEVEIDESNFIVEDGASPAEVKIKCSFSRPMLQRDRLYPITITFLAGYGGTAAEVPAKIRQAILMFVHHLYDNRIPVIQGTIVTKVPLSVESLLASSKRYNA